MPDGFAVLDTKFPSFRDSQTPDEKISAIQDYLKMLMRELRYTLHNLSDRNFNANSLERLTAALGDAAYQQAASAAASATAAATSAQSAIAAAENALEIAQQALDAAGDSSEIQAALETAQAALTAAQAAQQTADNNITEIITLTGQVAEIIQIAVPRPTYPTTGAANNYVLTIPGITSYNQLINKPILVRFHVTNTTGAFNVNINSLGNRRVYRRATSDPVSNTILDNTVWELEYSTGTHFMLVKPPGLGANIMTQDLAEAGTSNNPYMVTPLRIRQAINAAAAPSGHLTDTAAHQSELDAKQNKLVGIGAGQNIKTINNENILGTGNLEISSGEVTPLTTTGSANAYTLTPTPQITSYQSGQRWLIRFHTANTSATVNVNISGRGNRRVYQYGTTNPIIGQIATGSVWELLDDGNALIMVAAHNAVLLTGAQTIAGVKTFSAMPLVPTGLSDTQGLRNIRRRFGTLTSAGWMTTTITGPGGGQHHEQTLTGITGILANDGNDVEIDLRDTANRAQVEAWDSANIKGAGQTANSFKVIAWGDKPTIDIPIRVKIVGA